jgi:TrmH family RNA methyltransferase
LSACIRKLGEGEGKLKYKIEMLSKNQIKYINSLRRKKYRVTNNQFVVEGTKIILEGVSTDQKVKKIYFTKDLAHHYSALKDIGLAEEITLNELKLVSSLKSPPGDLAIFDIPAPITSDKLTGRWLALDDVRDPGNLGTIIRIADWFGLDGVLISNNSVDIFNEKVIQATMGSIFRVKFMEVDLVKFLQKQKIPKYGAFADGESVKNKGIAHDSILVMGNEGVGIRKEVEEVLSSRISIPGSGNAESLNVAVATGILCSYWN